MHRRHLLSLAAAVVLAAAAPALAKDVKAGPLRIENPWARPTPPGAPTGGAYMTIVNTGAQADRLVGGASPVAARLEVHEMSMDGGVMRMRKLDGLTIPPGASVALKPGGHHVMLIGLKRPLKIGETVPATLRFEKAGEVAVEFTVQPPPAPAHAHHEGH